jgi:hypothetical protein
MPVGRSSEGDPDRVVKRLRLLEKMSKVRDPGDRREADRALVEANRWLRRYPADVRVMEARDRLREVFPIDPEDTEETNGT